MVELGRDVKHGEEFTAPAVHASTHGFVVIEKPAKDKSKDED